MSNKLIKGPQQNSNDIVINDGSRVYNIKNQRGEMMGKFSFVPSDIGVSDRYKHAVKVFEELQSQLENTTDMSDKTMAEIKKKMVDEIDYAFDANVSESFFKITGPFTLLSNGDFFVVNIFEALRSVIEKETGVRLEKAKSRASKYTQKYHK